MTGTGKGRPAVSGSGFKSATGSLLRREMTCDEENQEEAGLCLP